MGSTSGPAPFSEIGKKARDLLNRDYNFNQKFTLSMLSSSGMELTATGVKNDYHFLGDLSTVHKSGRTSVDVKVDTNSNVTTKVTVNDILHNTKAALTFSIPTHLTSKRGETLILYALSQLDVQYLLPRAAINSSISLNSAPLLEFSGTIGSKELCLGGEVVWNTAITSLTKYNAGIGLNKPDYSAALLLEDKGQTVRVSYVHSLDSSTSVAAEMAHRLDTLERSFTIGSSHAVDPSTVLKTRFSNNGKVAMVCQREWRPKSLVTLSAEYDSKAIKSAGTKFGLALALKP